MSLLITTSNMAGPTIASTPAVVRERVVTVWSTGMEDSPF
jgi:hypothetical protein